MAVYKKSGTNTWRVIYLSIRGQLICGRYTGRKADMEMPFDSFVALYTKDTDGCMKKRNRYMVDQSAYCICTHLYSSVPYERNGADG